MMNKKYLNLILSVFFILLLSGFSEVDAAFEKPNSWRGMTMITPASQWREGLPSGNGKIGALVYGRIHKERILFNHNELWYGGRIVDVPDVSAELPVVRKLMLEGKYLEANDHYTNVLREKGIGSNARYHPAFDLLLTTETNRIFQDYKRTLNFETGEVEVLWRDGDTRFSRKLFVSIPDDISVMSLTADKKGIVSGAVTLDIHDLQDAIEKNGELFDPGFNYQSWAEGEFVIFSADGTDGGEFGAVARIIPAGGEMKTDAGGNISFKNSDEVLLLIGLFANEPASNAIARIKERLAAFDEGYGELLGRHQAIHNERFNSMAININSSEKSNTPNEYLLLDAYQGDISTELNQRLFDYGRYLLISSSRGGGYPPNLQGIWNGDYRPPWAGFLGLNENLQMTYWQGLPGNLPETMMGFYDYFDSELDNFRFNAEKLWGTRGIFIPPFMSPESGMMRHSAPHVVNWTDAAGWLASYYYDYYLFTGDKAFLKERAIPFMKEVALFYEDFIVKDDNGKNMFFPSQSPENQPKNMMIVNPETGREKRIKVQINSTIAVAISKEVFTNLITACELLGVEKKGVKRWKAILADMPEYQINEDGALKEWMHPDFKDNYEHRHQSHIYPLFPGHEITEESNPKLYEASKVAIEKRLTIGLKSQTGWSLAHMANVYARLGDGERAKEALDILSRCCLGQNLFTYHNDWRDMGVTVDLTYGRSAPFQMDANFGIPAAMTEMLCSSTSDMLRILPALPGEWAEGSFSNVLTRVGVSTSAQWNMNVNEIRVSLVAGRDTSFDLKFASEIISFESNAQDAVADAKYGNHYKRITLEKGDKLGLTIKLK
ncbi:MAG: glycoside hydrolase N-terminal domain-containing protein [Cyclobacteriaceae bacterium]